jgi:hypothetical protein
VSAKGVSARAELRQSPSRLARRDASSEDRRKADHHRDDAAPRCLGFLRA